MAKLSRVFQIFEKQLDFWISGYGGNISERGRATVSDKITRFFRAFQIKISAYLELPQSTQKYLKVSGSTSEQLDCQHRLAWESENITNTPTDPLTHRDSSAGRSYRI